MDDINHLESHSWFGQFSVPGTSITFPGRLTYSLPEGLRIDWLGEFPPEKLARVRQIEGILEGGFRCVLLSTNDRGIFDTHAGRRADLSFGKGYPQGVLFWGTAKDLKGLSRFSITVTNFNEFCFPQGFKVEAPGHGFEVEPFVVNDREISIWRSTTYGPISNDSVGANLLASDKGSGADVPIAVTRTDGQEGEFYLSLRSETDWVMSVKYETPQCFERVLRDLRHILSFCGYILQLPVAPISIHAYPESQDSLGRDLPVLMTRRMHPWAVEYAKRPAFAHYLPLRLEDLHFERVFSAWDQHKGEGLFRYLTHRIESGTGLSGPYDDYAQVLLLCTLLEDAGAGVRGSREEKYSWALDQWGHLLVKEHLLKMSGVSTIQSFGKLLGDLRNEIAHHKKRRVALGILDEWQIYGVCNIVQAILFSYSLSLLDVDPGVAMDAQHKLIFG